MRDEQEVRVKVRLVVGSLDSGPNCSVISTRVVSNNRGFLLSTGTFLRNV